MFGEVWVSHACYRVFGSKDLGPMPSTPWCPVTGWLTTSLLEKPHPRWFHVWDIEPAPVRGISRMSCFFGGLGKSKSPGFFLVWLNWDALGGLQFRMLEQSATPFEWQSHGSLSKFTYKYQVIASVLNKKSNTYSRTWCGSVF